MKILTIALLGLRRLLRDRTGLFFVLLLPVAITMLVGFAVFRNIGTSVPVGVHNQSEGQLSANLVRSLENSKALRLIHFEDRPSLETAIRRDEVQGGIAIPSNYDHSLQLGEGVAIDFIPSPRASNSQAVQSTVASIITAEGTAVRAATFATENSDVDFQNALALANHLKGENESSVSVSASTVGEESDRAFVGFSYPSASNLVLFMFITSMTAAGQLIETRRLGINRRMISTPSKPSVVMAGLTLSRFVIALFQGLFIFAATSLIFGVDWGSSLGAIMIIIAFALVSTGVALLFGSILRTQEQSNLGVPLGIGLGMLGGTMWPLEIVSPTMRTIGHFTPHAWAMDAFIALIGKGAGPGAILQNVAILLGFAALLMVVTVRRFRKGLTQ